ncbi:DUF3983 domain-containing protein [Bacillus sp. FDAARGOS_235]
MLRAMTNHKKKKVKKAITRCANSIDKYQTDKLWRNICVKRGILK